MNYEDTVAIANAIVMADRRMRMRQARVLELLDRLRANSEATVSLEIQGPRFHPTQTWVEGWLFDFREAGATTEELARLDFGLYVKRNT